MTPFHKLDIWEQLNVLADVKAKLALERHLHYGGTPLHISYMHNTLPSLSITTNGKTTQIVSKLGRSLHYHISAERIRNYWQHKGKKVTHEDCDRKAFNHASQNTSQGFARWNTKWQCGICGVGKWLERWKDQKHLKCPRCLQDNETVEHVLSCQHPDATLCWNSSIKDLRVWMDDHHAIPGLAEALGLHLTQWRSNQPFLDTTITDPTVLSIINAQDSVGWDCFFFGSLHRKWSDETGKYFEMVGRKTSGVTWTSQLIRKIWDLQHKMWLHRNVYVHKSTNSIHQHEEEALDRAIWAEFIIGRNGLAADYSGLFRGNVLRLLNQSGILKMQWIYRVWSGRDRLREVQGLSPWYKDPLAASFIDRARVRRKRRHGIG